MMMLQDITIPLIICISQAVNINHQLLYPSSVGTTRSLAHSLLDLILFSSSLSLFSYNCAPLTIYPDNITYNSSSSNGSVSLLQYFLGIFIVTINKLLNFLSLSHLYLKCFNYFAASVLSMKFTF